LPPPARVDETPRPEPVATTTIHTDDAGLEAGDVRIPVRDGEIHAYCAKPAGDKKRPVVLLVHEIWSVHEYFKDVARRLAKLGYLAVTPDLYQRQGDVTNLPREEIRKVVATVPDAQVMQDLDATARWAIAHGGDPYRMGVTGFCWGGRITWLYSAHNPGVKAGVAWYGRLAGTASPLTPTHPVDVVARLQAPVLGLYGGRDPGIPLDSVDRMKAALSAGPAAARRSEFVVYPDAPHAFHADYRPSYRPDAAADGWKRCLAWFKAHGVT
jgi:carboxymethylenebutenolidase